MASWLSLSSRSSHGLNTTKNVAAFDAVEPSRIESPPIVIHASTPGSSETIRFTSSTTPRVRPCDAASGSCTPATM